MKKLLPKTSKNPLGFTLIELLVAISIVAILAAIGLVSYSSVRGSARDAQRRSTIQAIAQSLESRKNTNGTYSLSTTNLTNEFPNDTNAQNGDDPSGIDYCIGVSTTITAPTAPTTDATWCPTPATTWYPLGTAAGTGVLNPPAPAVPTIRSWVLCASLEAGTNVFCVTSLTR